MLSSASNGAAVADAILVVAEAEPKAASFAWAPILPRRGSSWATATGAPVPYPHPRPNHLLTVKFPAC